MSKSSAFARVIGLTKSLSPLNSERAKVPQTDATDDIVAAAVADSEAMARRSATLETPPPIAAALIEVTPEQVAPSLADEQLDAAPVPAQIVELTNIDDVAIREAVAAEAIQTIEADIAKLLASIDTSDETMDASIADDESEPTLALLSELNRLWVADHGRASVAA